MANTFDMRLADLNIRVEYRYDYLPRFCKNYLVETHEKVDVFAATCDQRIAAERLVAPTASVYSCESLCIYREIAEQLPTLLRFVFHGAAISYKNKAYIFTAPSGTGKTTHISLWQKYIGEGVEIINGDKPIIGFGDTVTVYGTPWAGKENMQKNTSAPLDGICIIKRGTENKIRKLSPIEVLPHIMNQVYMPQDKEAMDATMKLIDRLITTVPIFILECDISEDAVKASFSELTKEEYK